MNIKIKSNIKFLSYYKRKKTKNIIFFNKLANLFGIKLLKL